jgi:hypothetical protein
MFETQGYELIGLVKVSTGQSQQRFFLEKSVEENRIDSFSCTLMMIRSKDKAHLFPSKDLASLCSTCALGHRFRGRDPLV